MILCTVATPSGPTIVIDVLIKYAGVYIPVLPRRGFLYGILVPIISAWIHGCVNTWIPITFLFLILSFITHHQHLLPVFLWCCIHARTSEQLRFYLDCVLGITKQKKDIEARMPYRLANRNVLVTGGTRFLLPVSFNPQLLRLVVLLVVPIGCIG